MNNIAPAQQSTQGFSEAQVAAENAAFMRKVYAIMAAGLGVTGLTALIVAHSPSLSQVIIGNRAVFYTLLLAELGMVLLFASLANRMSAIGAAALFYTYAMVNGLTLSVIFFVYTTSSIATTFWITAGTFGGMSIYGYTTKTDLTRFGSFLMMGLFGIIIASLVNIFLHSSGLQFAISVIGVVVFTGLTAYDTQWIKEMYVAGDDGTVAGRKAVIGALKLYLDFLNLFLFLLRFLGAQRR